MWKYYFLCAECILGAITFFGIVHHLFSSSPNQWELLQNCIGCSLHGMSETRCPNHVECIMPFAAHLPGIKLALEGLLELNLAAKTRNEVHGVLLYVTCFAFSGHVSHVVQNIR
ncbi:hypothetical protein JRQ81_014656 [Phrynocephalus forsythii]|uniref:Uncharacterized protein n=1 Tax=Phrynocephalus forsythii TaxID=171643 RepID=A0A9Q1B3B1_9SAUR|nr:hypothetical protein JRQ81_014656 [Phrynocephalus forsythii]